VFIPASVWTTAELDRALDAYRIVPAEGNARN
jgi:hypothetical protein